MTHINLDTTTKEQQPGEHEEFQVMGEELVATMKKLFHVSAQITYTLCF